ncbi:hypothetical protein MUP32_03280, partial [Candidatus Microgenomates bacterium]|nr:hypothetical protein [Candidatus Microgenomates bacterium]
FTPCTALTDVMKRVKLFGKIRCGNCLRENQKVESYVLVFAKRIIKNHIFLKSYLIVTIRPIIMTCKIRIKIGYVEIDYEGEENFFKEELPKMITEISHLVTKENIVKTFNESSDSTNTDKPAKESTNLDLSVTDISGKIGVKTGSDLIMAAAAYLTLVEKKESFTRDQIMEKMKTAPSYYKSSYLSNYTRYLNGLIGNQKLRQTSTGKYALSAATIKELEKQLVN